MKNTDDNETRKECDSSAMQVAKHSGRYSLIVAFILGISNIFVVYLSNINNIKTITLQHEKSITQIEETYEKVLSNERALKKDEYDKKSNQSISFLITDIHSIISELEITLNIINMLDSYDNKLFSDKLSNAYTYKDLEIIISLINSQVKEIPYEYINRLPLIDSSNCVMFYRQMSRVNLLNKNTLKTHKQIVKSSYETSDSTLKLRKKMSGKTESQLFVEDVESLNLHSRLVLKSAQNGCVQLIISGINVIERLKKISKDKKLTSTSYKIDEYKKMSIELEKEIQKIQNFIKNFSKKNGLSKDSVLGNIRTLQ